MKLLCAFLLVLGLQAQDPNYPIGDEFNPWETVIHQSCFAATYFVPGMVPITVRPFNMETILTSTVQSQSGYHPHTAVARPQGTVLNGRILQTNSDGCVYYDYKAPGYSGWTTFVVVPVDTHYRTGGMNNYFVYRDINTSGQIVQLTNFFYQSLVQPFTNHQDDWHGYYSRYGTRDSVDAMRMVAYAFANSYPQYNPGQYKLDIIRGSLPDGGIADNEMGATVGSGYIINQFDPAQPKAEQHAMGVEWDVANPSIATGDGGTLQILLNLVVNRQGCHLGKTDQYGTPVEPNGINGYWFSQSVVHIICSAKDPEGVM